MRKPNKNKMTSVNSRFASVSESIFNGFLLKMLLRSLPVYILKQLFFSISVNSGRLIFTSPLRGSVNILPRFQRIIVKYTPRSSKKFFFISEFFLKINSLI